MSQAQSFVPPVLRVDVAVFTSSVLTLCYVGGLYMTTATRVGSKSALDAAGHPLHKDHPIVVKARLVSVSWTASIGLAGTAGLLICLRPRGQTLSIAALQALRLLGLPSGALEGPLQVGASALALSAGHFLSSVALPVALTASLYIGPLYVSFLEKELPGQSNFDYVRDVRQKWDSLWGLRNFIIGPATEELVFRSCVVSLAFCSGASRSAVLFATPLYFGLAHVHHAWERYVRYGRTTHALKEGLAQSALQLAYTTLFGWYANFLLMRTGSIFSSFVAHVFCNIQGLPNPSRAFSDHPRRKRSICIAYMLGIVSFWKLLWPATSPLLYGTSVYWQDI